MTCIDLRAWADKHRYRWRLEESYKAEKDPEARGDGCWYVEVMCKYGLIYPWGEGDLLAFTDAMRILPQLLALEGVKVHQRGNGEAVVRFPERVLPHIARLLRPRRRGVGPPGGPPIEARKRGLRAQGKM